jgi:hypothetical protein
MLNSFFIENSIKSKQKKIREIETHFGILKSVQLIRFHEGEFIVFKPQV